MFKVVQPVHWAGEEKIPGVMVCGACRTPAECSIGDRCKRASDADYEQVISWGDGE